MDAERAIAKANPPNHGGKGTPNKSCEISNPTTLEQPIPSSTIRDMRKAYDNITDEEFEEAKQEAIEHQKPLTRAYFKEKSQEKKGLRDSKSRSYANQPSKPVRSLFRCRYHNYLTMC